MPAAGRDRPSQIRSRRILISHEISWPRWSARRSSGRGRRPHKRAVAPSHPAKPGDHISGTLVGSANLASGRYAMTAGWGSAWCRGSWRSTSASPGSCAEPALSGILAKPRAGSRELSAYRPQLHRLGFVRSESDQAVPAAVIKGFQLPRACRWRLPVDRQAVQVSAPRHERQQHRHIAVAKHEPMPPNRSRAIDLIHQL
jgi:hypothetical protein